MSTTKRGAGHGCVAVSFGIVNTAGRSYGAAGTSLAVDTVTGNLVDDTPKNASLPLPDRTVVDFTGGDRWLGSYQYGITSLGSMAATFDSVDADLVALLSGSLVDQTTTSAWTIFAENILAQTIPQVCEIVTFRLQGRGTDEGGDFFINAVIGRSWSGPKGFTGAPAFQTAGEYNVQITPTATNVFPHGVAFGANQGWYNNSTPVLWIISGHPIHCATWLANGSATTFTLPYLPTSSSVTLATGPNQTALNGTATAVTSISTSTGEVDITTPGAGTSGDYWGILYETDFVPSP